jgi:hypothetical protein
VLPGHPAPTGPGAGARATGGDVAATDARPSDEVVPGRRRVDVRQGRWLPRHQPWNAASGEAAGRPTDDPSAQLEELDELRLAGLLSEEEFARRRAWLLGS